MNCKLGLYEKSMPDTISLREKLLASKQAGYDFMELSIDESDARLARLDWSKQERLELVEAMFETGQPIKTICLSGHRKYPLGTLDEADSIRSLEIMEKTILLACDLGVRIVQIAGYDVYYQTSTAQTSERFAHNLEKCVRIAAQYGVILAFETMETDFMNTTSKAMHYVEAIASPYLQVYLDIGNITCAAVLNGTNALDDLETGKGHLAAMHLKETAPGIYREVPYGKGHVDFAGLIKRGQSLGVRLFVAEFWYNQAIDWRQELTNNYEYIKKFMN